MWIEDNTDLSRCFPIFTMGVKVVALMYMKSRCRIDHDDNAWSLIAGCPLGGPLNVRISAIAIVSKEGERLQKEIRKSAFEALRSLGWRSMV